MSPSVFSKRAIGDRVPARGASCENPRPITMNGATRLDAVLFDFNGVLVDDEHLHFEGFNAVLSPLGITLGQREYDDVYLGFDDRGVFETALRAHGREADAALVRALIDAKAKVYAARAATELRVFEGAAPLLRACAARAPVLIVSGALRAEIEGALAVMCAGDSVRSIVSAEDVSACKPDPAGYLLGLARLRHWSGDVDPARCVVVEDSSAGVHAARAAGLKVLAVAHTYPRDVLSAAGAHEVIAALRDVRIDDLEALAAL